MIAMKLDEGDRLIGVATCREGDDVLLATAQGRCIRFRIADESARVRRARRSGVRGIGWRRATRSSACRCCAMSMRRRRSGSPI